MGRTSTLFSSGLFSSGLVVAALPIAAALFGTANSQTIAHANPAQVNQTTPIIWRAGGTARDADTSQDDITITNGCIDRGKRKTECLCVTQILKYERDLSDYRSIAATFRTPVSSTEKPAQDVAWQIADALSSDADFAQRCAHAAAYFDAGAKPRR